MLIPSTYSIRSGKYLLKCKGLTSYCTLEERDIVHEVFKVIIGMLCGIHTYIAFKHVWQLSHSSYLRIFKLELWTLSIQAWPRSIIHIYNHSLQISVAQYLRIRNFNLVESSTRKTYQ